MKRYSFYLKRNEELQTTFYRSIDMILHKHSTNYSHDYSCTSGRLIFRKRGGRQINWAATIQDTSFDSTSLGRTSQILCLLHIEGVCSPASSKSVSTIFPTAFALHISVSHFGNSHISNIFIINIFVMLIYDQWSLMLLLQLFGAPQSTPI